MRHRFLALVLASFLVVVAAACGSSEPPPKGIELVSVEGSAGKKPSVTFEKPFKTTKTQSKVLKEGTGSKVAAGQEVVVDYVGVNGRDSKEFDSSWKQGQSVTFGLQKGRLIPGFYNGLVGKSVGDRVLVTMPPKDGYGQQGQPKVGIKGTDSLVFVIDVKDAYTPLPQAKGEAVAPPPGLPTVKVTDKGVPESISVPKGAEPPTKLVAQPLIKGEGEKIDAKATVNFHYAAVNWRTGKEFDSSWKRQQHENLPLGQTTVAGLREGLVGQTAGSRVLLVVPPDKGFGRDLQNTDVKKTDTVVFVVDILGPM
ncbi:MAG: FKBP-type peptidyl-prolyl cis-trans isomerase [Actinopolymorphaceae bacterium]